MSTVLFLMIACGGGYALLQGNAPEAVQAVLKAGEAALNTAGGLLSGFMLFGGVISILEKAGAIRLLVRLLHRPLRQLFGSDAGEEAMGAISLNLAANMLGLGNAATPMGMRAAKLLNAGECAVPSAALCMLLVINATSVQLAPTTVVAMRHAAGSVRPEAIVLPSLAASAASTAVGVLLCRLCERRKKKA